MCGTTACRYICVCHPILAKKLCTIKNVIRAIVVIYAIAILSQLTVFVDKHFQAVNVPSLVHGPNVTVVGCVKEYAWFVKYDMNLYFNVYYWFRVIFIHLVPCSILIVLNALLVRTMRQAQRRRRQLLAQNRKSECRRLAERNMTTMMLVVVVGIFLLAELPNALLFIIMIVDNTWESSTCSLSISVATRRLLLPSSRTLRSSLRQHLGTSDPDQRVVVDGDSIAESLHLAELPAQLLHLLRDEPPVPRRVPRTLLPVLQRRRGGPGCSRAHPRRGSTPTPTPLCT